MDTPRGLGFRIPAEWDPQEGVWLSWPTNQNTWRERWVAVKNKFAEITLKLSQFESVFINCVESERPGVEKLLAEVEKSAGLTGGDLQFFNHRTNDVWVRDYGPIYLRHAQSGALALTDWDYNGWGEKYPYKLDNLIPSLIENASGLPCFNQLLVLEGGSIETNGVGDILVTRDCLLNSNRNPKYTSEEISQVLRVALGVEKIHWLDGCIEGDDTDGHIDNLVRFFKPNGVLMATTDHSDVENHEMLARLNRQCSELETTNGDRLEVVALPLPEPIYQKGKRLPMCYLNFFIANRALLFPVFGQPESDTRAGEILTSSFPGREIIPIDCQDLIHEGGALHCLTQQVPQTCL